MKAKLLVLLAIFTIGCVASAADAKFGYVDMRRAILSTKAGKQAKKKLEAAMNKKKKVIEKRRNNIEKMQKDFEKKALVLSDDVKNKKAAEIQRNGMKLQELFVKSQQEIQKKERDLQAPIIETLRSVIKDIAKKEKYSMVFEKSEQSILWAPASSDLTKKVVKSFEKKFKYK